MTQAYAQCGDQKIAYYDDGAPDGAAVVFAHATGLDHSQWDAVLALLAPTLRLIRFDLRGHGASATPSPPYTMGALVRDAETLLDCLGVKDCVFVGSALGGMLGQALAVKRLDQIRALVLANTATKIGTKDTWARVIEDTRSNGLEARFTTDIAQSFSTAFLKSPALDTWAALLRRQRLDGFLGCAAAIAGTDFYTTTASLRLPCCVIAGANDAITPPDMVRELAELIPGGSFHLIRKAGHFPMIEQPEIFAQLLSCFLKDIGHG
jgi:3-oxoadipate enol-lactonase